MLDLMHSTLCIKCFKNCSHKSVDNSNESLGAGFKKTLIELKSIFGLYAFCAIKSDTYFLWASLAALWYHLRHSLKISYDIWSLSFFQLCSAHLHSCLMARMGPWSHGCTFFSTLDICILRGATESKVEVQVLLKRSTNSSGWTQEDRTFTSVGIWVDKYTSLKDLAVEELKHLE